MTVKTETLHAGHYISSEGNKSISREQGVLASGQAAILRAGTVLGLLTINNAAVVTPKVGNTGNGVMGAVVIDADGRVGTYKLRVTKAAANAGDFEVFDPDGNVIGVGTVGVQFKGGGLTFTLADGATDFVVGDEISVAVSGSGKYTALDLAAATGAEDASAILFDDVDAQVADAPCVLTKRLSEVKAASLIWPAGITNQQKTDALARLAKNNVIAR